MCKPLADIILSKLINNTDHRIQRKREIRISGSFNQNPLKLVGKGNFNMSMELHYHRPGKSPAKIKFT